MKLELSLSVFFLLGLPACGGSAHQPAEKRAEARSPKAAIPSGEKDRNACHLLSHEEVSALVEKKIVMRDQVEAGETWSECQWEDESGIPLFTLTVYWEDGRENWQAWRTAQGLSDRYFQKVEGVRPDEIVKQGPVAGIGDGAYFSELLPCLVLKGDTLFEFTMNYVPNAAAKFRPLTEKLLATVD